MHLPLALLSPMAQSGHGVTQIMEAHKPLSVGAFAPPEFESPHALIEPSALRVAKALSVE
jgi:hypothetical protein